MLTSVGRPKAPSRPKGRYPESTVGRNRYWQRLPSPGPQWQRRGHPAGPRRGRGSMKWCGFAKTPPWCCLKQAAGLSVTCSTRCTTTSSPVVCINPKQARDFARACGARAKTDNVDARRLALVGQRMIPQTQSAPDPAQIELKSLLMPSKATRQKSRCRKVSTHPTLSTLDGFGAATPHVVERRNRRA